MNGIPRSFWPDMLTIRENSAAPFFNRQTMAYLGDARYNMGNSLMIGSAMLGLDFRSISPKALQTSDEVHEMACRIAQKPAPKSRARMMSILRCRLAIIFIRMSGFQMGEPEEVWEERIRLLAPYRVTMKVMEKKTGKNDCKFLHCLPAFHNRDTTIGEQIYQKFGIDCMEVDDEVFESEKTWPSGKRKIVSIQSRLSW